MNNPDEYVAKKGDEYEISSEAADKNSLQEQLKSYDLEKNILLELSDDITKVREKNDLIKLFSSRLKAHFYFTHAVISLIDQQNRTYYPFLIDRDSMHIRHREELPSLLEMQFSIDDPFIGQVPDSDRAVTILLDEIIDEPGIPAFLKVNYECGIKKAMIAKLKSKMEVIGYVFLYSDRIDSFPEHFQQVIQGITPHLSNAVDNIIINDDIRYKEIVNEILLSLSNDMVTVRDRTDLLNVISFGLKKLIYFTHSTMATLSESGDTYHAFLIDPDSRAKRFPQYSEAITVPNPVDDGIYNVAAGSDKPVVFNMASIDVTKAPLWFKLNIEAGGKEMLVKVLPGKDTPQHSLILFSDRINNFDEKAVNIIQRISSQLATAASNISANEEIINKEKDKSFLLDFSQRLASARTKNELSLAIHGGLKKLTQVRAYFIRTMNEDGTTMSPFMHDEDVHYIKDPAFKELLATKIPIDAGITGKVMKGNVPVHIDFEEEIRLGHTDHYIEFWKQLGPKRVEFQKMIGTPLSVGDKKFGVLWIITPQMNSTVLEGVCAQISVAISNIKSNEEIVEREEEKSILLSISREIAALRYRDDLLKVVNKQFKTLFSIENFGLLQINDDNTYSTFSLDLNEEIASQPEYEEVTSTRNSVSDKVFTRMMDSNDPVIFDVNELAKDPDMPRFVRFWKQLGLQRVLGSALRAGGKNIGCTFLHIDSNKTGKIKLNLLKSVCAQIAVAMSNIMSNEKIAQREEEKSILLSLSDEIAALRSRDDLLRVVNTKIKVLFELQEFGIAQIDEDGETYSSFVMDLDDQTKSHSHFKEVTSAKYKITDPVFSVIMESTDPILLDVDMLSKQSSIPDYVAFWKMVGLRYVLGAALRAGGKNIGCVFLHIDPFKKHEIKINLVKAVCAQLAVSVSNILANEQILSYKQMLEVENAHLKEQIKTIYNFSDIIGSGPEMQKVYHMMSLVAETNSTVLLLGETGTGKELIARAVHNASPRKNKLMVKVNCAALPANLIESELFGHEKGSFTGAIDRRIGKFELANNSSIFLDEIGEMPLETQVKLLRVLQERELERVGGKATIKVDVRIIAATNRNLEEEVKAGKFRSDLYYRLNVFPIALPPLRDRLEDIAPLANFFLTRYCKNTGKKITGISPKVIQQLKSYLWPGNVRELEHLIERSVLLTTGKTMTEIQLPESRKADSDGLNLSRQTLQQLERIYIIDTLKRCGGKISGQGGAADLLELPSTTLHSKMKKLGITKGDYFPKQS